ncbi:MAG: hypothetical protein DUD27_00710 [Lachnospiraceae bacterium]|uniref:Uncharacterized protein n=1 Tax=Candidatus Weimeria bifida TaxID=2599074 RepID=A0A6N7J2B9_9FIRM|nr:hypothetical protein [Candidatus Weimeria bifida]RRF97428.1 MAG: hypothetical protein DUD27_00710 [Lachnospiraceae bacterium]
MTDKYYFETDPQIRQQLLAESGEERAKELFLIRHSDEKTGEKNLGRDRYLWFLMCLDILVRQRPFFVKREAKKVKKTLNALTGSAGVDQFFIDEMRNAAMRLFSTSGTKGEGQRLLGFGSVSDEYKIADQCMDAWRIIYGAPQVLNMDEELAPVSNAVKEAYCLVDDLAADRLEELREKLSRKGK